jgi:glycosyltransferase involved in cell wall biosynthesis
MKVYIDGPDITHGDTGEGGIRRVVEAQRQHLPQYGIEVVDDPEEADLYFAHAYPLAAQNSVRNHPERPLIIGQHGCYWDEYTWSKAHQEINAYCMEAIRQADYITAPSEWLAQAIRRNSLREVEVIPHGVELDEWPPKQIHIVTGLTPDQMEKVLAHPPNPPYVLWNKTRVDPVCDPTPLERLVAMAPDVQFVSTFALEATPANLTVLGKLPYEEGKKWVREAYVYLATSRETFGIGTIEAMASACPVLGFAWGGQNEYVEHKVSGYLARPGDYDDLLTGLRYCLDPENRARMAEAARKTVSENFRWKYIIKRYADLYKRAVEAFAENRPTVSVVVPTYNLADLLPETLASLEAQSFRDFEVIIVDDASTDDSGAIADAFARKQGGGVTVIHNTENQYLAGTLNIGAEVARGKYLINLDADNLLTPNALAILAGRLDADRSIDIAYGNVEFLEPDGRRWHSNWPPEFRTDWQIKGDSNLIPSTAMLRRRVWELTGGWRRRWRTAEDADFWTRATSYGFRAVRATEADVLVYRNRPGSMSLIETKPSWSKWYPWTWTDSIPPAAITLEPQVKVPSMEPVLVSVIIPVGPGHEELCIDAMDSVDSQTFRLWEMIIVNDSGKPLRWTPSYARIINTAGGLGPGAARNVGIRSARGSTIIPLDADDTLEPSAIAIFYNAYKEFGGYAYSDYYSLFDGEQPRVWKVEDYDPAKLVRTGSLHAVTALYSKADLMAVGLFDEELPWEDWDLQLKLANVPVCGTHIEAPLFTYRKSKGKRREANYAVFDESKKLVAERWLAYLKGEKTLAGCGSCGGRKVTPPSQRTSPPQSPANSDAVKVRYVGTKLGAQRFAAPSGQPYRFSAQTGESEKYVLAGDVEWFLGMRDFERAESVPVG